jgi:hypothetical protein
MTVFVHVNTSKQAGAPTTSSVFASRTPRKLVWDAFEFRVLE